MSNDAPGAGRFVQNNMATPTAGVGTPTWASGSSMLAATVLPILPGVAFDARGTGRFDLTTDTKLGPRVSGRQGSIDLAFVAGATGTARTLAYLTDSLTSPTRYILLGIDTSNRPRLVIKDELGTTVASVTPSYTAIASGQTVLVRMTWDSLNPVYGTRQASLRVNRELIPDGDWATDPTADWTHFQPTHLVLGAGLAGASDFNGTISLVQVSNVVSP